MSSFGVQGCEKSGPTKEQKALVQTETEKLNIWFEDRHSEMLARSPMRKTQLGIDENQNILDDISELARAEETALKEVWLAELRRTFDPDRLDPSTRISYRLYEYAALEDLAENEFSDNLYAFQHMSGPHTGLPAFMSNVHRVDSVKDAENYISRLNGFSAYLGEFVARAETQANNNVILPRFVYPRIRDAAVNVISGQPFDENGDSPLWSDVTRKIEALDISPADKTSLKNEARVALFENVKPAYLEIIDMCNRHEAMADDQDGVWKLPGGAAFYQARLKRYTTTDLSPDEIHRIGLEEVARIKEEMRSIMDDLDYEGDYRSFFDKLRSDPEFVFENTDEGRASYISQAETIISDMKGSLDQLFETKPKADVIVKRVEPFREASAFGAFYNEPSRDGSRPGTYYINLKDMNDLPIYQLQALAYHEGIPGHHMQIAIAQELEGLPTFRTSGRHTAYTEGWALYAERIPKELGLYTDPYQDFGRLSMEIFRAARLVVDTGIHHKKWTRAEAVEYMMNNTANAEGDIRDEVDRYIVWPGQATAYKIGMLKIDELRAKAKASLGDGFDIREFHDVILANGSMPLSILEDVVDDWIAAK